MVEILSVIRWQLSLGAKFYRVVPFLTSSIVILTLVAQISSLLAFFLPLKIIILLGSEGTPRYFPDSLANIDRDWVIAGLSAATMALFFLSLLAEKLIKLATTIAATKLLEKSQKMTLFENQAEIAERAYRSYSTALAAAVFIPLALLALGWFYPSMAMLILIYSLSNLILFLQLYKVNKSFKDNFNQTINFSLSLSTNLGFFLVFSYLIIDFIFLTPPGFITAIISLIGSRQIFNREVALSKGLLRLSQQSSRLTTLFFHGKITTGQHLSSKTQDIWEFLQPEIRAKWISAALTESCNHRCLPTDLNTQWLMSSKPNMPHILVTDLRSPKTHFLVKLFNKTKKSAGLHEATLTSESFEGVPAPELITSTEIDKFYCLIYRLRPGKLVRSKYAAQKAFDLEEQTMTANLSKAFADRYSRSHLMLPDRISCTFLNRIYVFAQSEIEFSTISELIRNLSAIKSNLHTLPTVIINAFEPRSLWEHDDDHSVIALDWSDWALEPLGSALSRPIDSYTQAISKLIQKSALPDVDFVTRKIEIASSLYSLEEALKKQNSSQVLFFTKKVSKLIAGGFKCEVQQAGGNTRRH